MPPHIPSPAITNTSGPRNGMKHKNAETSVPRAVHTNETRAPFPKYRDAIKPASGPISDADMTRSRA